MTDEQQTQPARPKRKWLRRILLTLALLVLVFGVMALFAYRSAGSVPDWYAPADADATSQQARQAEEKLADVQTWAASKHAYEYASTRGKPLARRPDDELVVSFTQGEVNSFLSKWYTLYGPQPINGKKLEDVFKAPMVRIEKDRITVAGTVQPLGGRVVSLDLRPTLVDGALHLEMLTARSGNLALPEFTWGRPRQMLIEALQGMVLNLAPQAAFDKAGAANPAAMSATMAMQGADSLQHRPTLNVLYLPVASEPAGMPVRLKRCELEEGQITLVTEPLDAAGRDAVLHRLRGGTEPQKTPIYLTPSTRSTQ